MGFGLLVAVGALTHSRVLARSPEGPAPGTSEERLDEATLARIREEAKARSQILRTLHFLTDVHGPRLTGSPNHKAAADWAVTRLRDWGLSNAHLEPWDFGHPGWVNERFAGFLVSPVKDSLVGEVLAWTPSTKGTVRAHAVRIEPPRCVPAAPASPAPPPDATPGPPPQTPENCPTKEDLTAFLETSKAKVKDAIVLVGAPAKVAVNFNPPALRRDDERTRRQYAADDPSGGPDANRPSPPAASPSAAAPARAGERLTANQAAEIIDQFLVASGALLRVNDAGRDHGQIRAFSNRTYDLSKAVPTVVLRNEDFGRISRLLDDGLAVELEFTIVNQTYPEGRTSYNVVAEIPGTDKKNEVVMLGAHLDSWHSATGATDNGIGSAMMMEAVRVLKALGLQPRRTIRIGLWSGEEQGLLGSKAYVKEHFGTFENPTPEFATLDAYFNIDSGTGRVRGASVFGPTEAAAVLRRLLSPFAEQGVAGATAGRRRRAGGTDSGSFNEAGLPGVGLGQDPIQYNSHTWHTNLDTYERIVEEDVILAATVIASVVYHVAMREEMLPRFAKDQMPAPPPPSPAPSSVPATTTVGGPTRPRTP